MALHCGGGGRMHAIGSLPKSCAYAATRRVLMAATDKDCALFSFGLPLDVDLTFFT
jgi:hypothetical protein